MKPLIRILFLPLLTVLLLAPGQFAAAHDELLSSNPEDGDTLETAPEELRLTFTGNIGEIGAQLGFLDENGELDDSNLDGDPQISGTELVQPLEELDPGQYEVAWRVTSEDGHPISGTLEFTIADSAADPGDNESTPSDEETAAGEETGDEESSPAETSAEETTSAAAVDETADATTANEEGQESGSGIPTWVWLVLVIAVLALVGLLGRTWARGREISNQ